MTTVTETRGTTKAYEKTVNSDQECWVKISVRRAVQMALAVREARQSWADDNMVDLAIDGIIDGAVASICKDLSMQMIRTVELPYLRTRVTQIIMGGGEVAIDTREPLAEVARRLGFEVSE